MCVTWGGPPYTMTAMPTTDGTPRMPSSLEAVPHGRTARRLDWRLLPPMTRRLVEGRFGTTVVDSFSAGAGFTPGCASVLVGADGRKVFLKAASKKAQRPFADAYREEIHKLRSLPAGLPVPTLLWSHEDDLWVLLGLEYVDGHNPVRPWRPDELDASLDTLELLAQTLTPPPMALDPFAHEFADFLLGWQHVRAVAPDWPHLDDAVELAARYESAGSGNTMVHTDARDDNILITARRAYLCDWNGPVVGAAWIDTVCLLMTAFGDGVDADSLLAERRLTRNVDPTDIDSVLALMCGYFLQRRDEPAPHSSPYLRRHQDWCAEVTWAWLAQRRGWS
jgi:aminoglycoside phosphotransferase (APT) family kinase protein